MNKQSAPARKIRGVKAPKKVKKVSFKKTSERKAARPLSGGNKTFVSKEAVKNAVNELERRVSKQAKMLHDKVKRLNAGSIPLKGSGGRVGVSSQPMNFHGQHGRGLASSRRESGMIFVEVVKAPASNDSGTIIWSRKNRCAIAGTYLEVLAGIYTRWRIHNYRYVFKPSPGSTFASQLVGAIDPDPLSAYTSLATNVNRLSALDHSMVEQIWKGLSFKYPRQRDRSDLWTKDLDPSVDDYADRFSIAGNAFLAVVTKGDITSGTELGSVFLEFDIEFYEPKLSLGTITGGVYVNLSDATGGNAFINAVAGANMGLIQTGINIVIGLAAAATPSNLWELLSELVMAYYEAVPWPLIPFEARSRFPGKIINYTIDPEYRTTAYHLGAAPTEVPGLAPGRYRAELCFYTTEPMWNTGTIPQDHSESAILVVGFVNSGAVSNNTHSDTTVNLEFQGGTDTDVTDSSTFRNPDTGNVFKNVARIWVEFVVVSSRGVYEFVFERSNHSFTKTAGDECMFRFTRISPASGISYVLGDVGRPSIIEVNPIDNSEANPTPNVVKPSIFSRDRDRDTEKKRVSLPLPPAGGYSHLTEGDRKGMERIRLKNLADAKSVRREQEPTVPSLRGIDPIGTPTADADAQKERVRRGLKVPKAGSVADESKIRLSAAYRSFLADEGFEEDGYDLAFHREVGEQINADPVVLVPERKSAEGKAAAFKTEVVPHIKNRPDREVRNDVATQGGVWTFIPDEKPLKVPPAPIVIATPSSEVTVRQ